MVLFLGVDVGGTKTAALIANENGEALGYGIGGAGNYEGVGWDGFKTAVKEATEKALTQSDQDFSSIAGNSGLLTYSNGPDPDYLFSIFNNKYFSTHRIWNSLGAQEFADLFFCNLAQRNKSVTGTALANGKRQLCFIQIEPFN